MLSSEVVVPVFFFMAVVAVLGALILTRHRERMTMIEKGLKAEEIRQLYTRPGWRMNPLGSLKWGIVFVGIGLAVLLGLYLHGVYEVQEGIYPGLIALLGGLGLVIFYAVAHKKIQP